MAQSKKAEKAVDDNENAFKTGEDVEVFGFNDPKFEEARSKIMADKPAPEPVDDKEDQAAQVAKLVADAEMEAREEVLENDPTYNQALRIVVKSGFIGTPDEQRVAFSDVNPMHGPEGAFVVGDKEVEIAVTPEVLDAVRAGRLVLVEDYEAADEVAEEYMMAGAAPHDAKHMAREEAGVQAARKLAEMMEEHAQHVMGEGIRPSMPGPGQTKGVV